MSGWIEIINTDLSTPFTGAVMDDMVFTTALSNQRICFASGSNTVPVMTVSNNQVGIGTMTPQAAIHVAGSAYFTSNMTIGQNLIMRGMQIERRDVPGPYNITTRITNVEGFSNTGGTIAITASNGSNINISGLITTTNQIQANTADTVTVPGYSWSNDTNTGVYHVGTGQVGVTCSGTQVISFATTGASITGLLSATGQHLGNQNDTATAPAYSWTGDTTTGIYNVSPGQVGVTCSGTQVIGVTSTLTSITNNIDINNRTRIIASTGQIQANQSDSFSAPSYTWSNDNSTGLYHLSTGTIGIASGGNTFCTVDSNRMLFDNFKRISWKDSSGTTKDVLWVDNTNTTKFVSVGGAMYINPDINAYLHLNWSNTNGFAFYNGTTAILASSGTSIGVGTTTPQYRLDVNGTMNASTVRQNGNEISTLFLSKSGDISSGHLGLVNNVALRWNRVSSGTPYNVLLMDNTDNVKLQGPSTIWVGSLNNGNTEINHNSDGAVKLYSASIQTVTVTNNKVGINLLSPSYELDMFGSGAIRNNSGAFLRFFGNNSGSTNFIYIGADSANNFVCYNQAGVGMYMLNGRIDWGNTSDINLKKNITPLPGPVLPLIERLNPVLFNWKCDPDDEEPLVGFIAQEVQEVIPRMVQDREGTLGITITNLIPYLVKAIQDQQKQINSMIEQIASLQQTSVLNT